MTDRKIKRMHDLIEEADRASKSITHKHILSIINTRLRAEVPKAPVRILDAGCGNCDLIDYLESFASRFQGGLQVEVHGFDVFDSKVQFSGFDDEALGRLQQRHANIDWRHRLHTISQNDPWPFDDATFDIVVSNQVLEHVGQHEGFLAQNWRVLKDNGFSIHLFPVKNYIMEGHIHLPFVHRIRPWKVLVGYIKTLSRLGFGKWKEVKDHCSLEDYARSYADFLTFYCNYPSIKDLLAWGKKAGFRTGFDYTGNFYIEKLREICRLRPRFFYAARPSHPPFVHLYKYIQCVTLVLDKADNYLNYIAMHSPERRPDDVA